MKIRFACLVLLWLASWPASAAFAGTYGVTGVTLGTPGLVNLNLGYYGGYAGCMVSVSFLHVLEALADDRDTSANRAADDSGLSFAMLQLNLDLKMYETEHFMMAASAAGGTFYVNDRSDPESRVSIFYAGPCVHLLWYGFFLEAGAAYARDFSVKYELRKTHLFPLVQLGYVGKL